MSLTRIAPNWRTPRPQVYTRVVGRGTGRGSVGLTCRASLLLTMLAARRDRLVQMSNWSGEETDDPHYADRRNFYKVEKRSRDGLRVELMLYAGNNLDKARRIFERTTKQRRRIRLTIRQRMRVLDEWPRHETLLLRRATGR